MPITKNIAISDVMTRNHFGISKANPAHPPVTIWVKDFASLGVCFGSRANRTGKIVKAKINVAARDAAIIQPKSITGRIPLSTKDLGDAGSIQGVLVGSGTFVDEHPEAVATLLKAQQQAVQWLTDDNNRQAYIQVVSWLASYPPVILPNDLKDQKRSEIFPSTLDPVFLAKLQDKVDLASQQRLIRKPFQVSDWVAPKLAAAGI